MTIPPMKMYKCVATSDSLFLQDKQPCFGMSFTRMLYDTDQSLDIVPLPRLPDGFSADSSLSGPLSPPTSSLDGSPFSLAHVTTRSGSGSSMSLGPIGFDSAAYTRVLRQHQIRLKEANEEYERLK
jgi:hypothetical protein